DAVVAGDAGALVERVQLAARDDGDRCHGQPASHGCRPRRYETAAQARPDARSVPPSVTSSLNRSLGSTAWRCRCAASKSECDSQAIPPKPSDEASRAAAPPRSDQTRALLVELASGAAAAAPAPTSGVAATATASRRST